MSVADKAQRTTIIIMAVVFFVTTIGLSIFVIVDAVQQNKTAKPAENSQQANQQGKDEKAGKPLENFTPVAEVTGLKTEDLKPGDGKEITSADQTVKADYTGAVAATGTVFQSSIGSQPFETQLTNVIPGWRDGMIGMKVGGTRRMLIPAEQAYGANPPQGSGIPANAALVFDVTLHDVKDTAPQPAQ